MLSVLPHPIESRGLDLKEREKESFSFGIMWHNESSPGERAFTKPWQKSQIDTSGGDAVGLKILPQVGTEGSLEGSVLYNTRGLMHKIHARGSALIALASSGRSSGRSFGCLV